MQRYLGILVAFLLVLPAQAAISATQVWEVEGGVGNDNFGGGFDSGVTSPGTDYSQSGSAHVVFDGSTIAAHAAGVTATIILTGYTVATTDVGNTFQITGGSGFTAGFYTIISVSVGSVTWTLDRNATTGVASGATGNMGGALNTIAKAAGAEVAGNTIYIKASATYTVTAALTVSISPNPVIVTSFVGYTSSRTDNGQATWTTATNSVSLIQFANAAGITLRNLRLTNTAGTPGLGALVAFSSADTVGLSVVNCYLSGFQYGLYGNYNVDYSFEGLLVDSTEITAMTTGGILNSSNTAVLASYIHANTGIGISINSARTSNLVVESSVIKSNTSDGILSSVGGNNANVIVSNTALINNGGNGINKQGAGELALWNCIIDSNGGYGVSFNSTPHYPWGPSFRSNAYGSGGTANTSGDLQGSLTKSSTDVTMTGDPFTSRSGNNFTLNNTAGAGAALRAAGYPGNLTWGTSNTGYGDIGALQHQTTGTGAKAVGFVGP